MKLNNTIKRASDVFIWLVLLTIVSYLFVFINHYVTPAGLMGSLGTLNVFASSIYILAWLFLSIWAGMKKRLEVLIASLIYSLYPTSLFLSWKPISNLIFYLLGMLWTFPIQGFLVYQNNYNTLFNIMAFIQPIIFIMGYMTSRYIKNGIEHKSKTPT